MENKEIITVEDRDTFSDLMCAYCTVCYALERIDECDNEDMFMDIANTYSKKMQGYLDILARKLA